MCVLSCSVWSVVFVCSVVCDCVCSVVCLLCVGSGAIWLVCCMCRVSRVLC